MNKGESTRNTGGDSAEPRLSRASVGRFSLYLRHLQRLHEEGCATVSSGQLGVALGLNDAQVRKDLAYLGNLGQPGIGYPTPDLIAALRARLGINHTWSVVVVGIGNLGRALLRYGGFPKQGFRFVALIDTDPTKIGQTLDSLDIHPPENMAAVIAQSGAELGILAVPAESAQLTADQLVAAGIKGILNFAPSVVRVPQGVSLVSVDLAVQLEQLAFLVHLEASSFDTR